MGVCVVTHRQSCGRWVWQQWAPGKTLCKTFGQSIDPVAVHGAPPRVVDVVDLRTLM